MIVCDNGEWTEARVEERIEQASIKLALSMLCDELDMLLSELAVAIGVQQPAITHIENADHGPRLSTLKRYVTALGGELSIDITLPTGKRVVFHL